MRSPGQHMIIKIRCCFRKCGQEGGGAAIWGQEGPLAGAQGALLPPGPHPPPNALPSGRWAGAVARQTARVPTVPRCCGRGGAREKRGCVLGASRAAGRTHREKARRGGRRDAVRLLSRGRRGESRPSDPCERFCGKGEQKGERGFSSPEAAGGAMPATTKDAVDTGSSDGVPSPLMSKDVSSRSIPGRWPCP